MKQIVDKLNKIAKKIDDSVELPKTNLITDSLDAITKALGGTPNDSNLIVDKLEDIAKVATKGGGGDEPIVYIPEQTVIAEEIVISQERSMLGCILNNVAIDLDSPPSKLMVTINNVEIPFTYYNRENVYVSDDESIGIGYEPTIEKWIYSGAEMQVGDSITISAVSAEDSSGTTLRTVFPETSFTSVYDEQDDANYGTIPYPDPEVETTFFVGMSPIYIVYDGTQYEVEYNGDGTYGELDEETMMPSFENYPFFLQFPDITTSTAGEHTIEIKAAPIFPSGTIEIKPTNSGTVGFSNYNVYQYATARVIGQIMSLCTVSFRADGGYEQNITFANPLVTVVPVGLLNNKYTMVSNTQVISAFASSLLLLYPDTGIITLDMTVSSGAIRISNKNNCDVQHEAGTNVYNIVITNTREPSSVMVTILGGES